MLNKIKNIICNLPTLIFFLIFLKLTPLSINWNRHIIILLILFAIAYINSLYIHELGHYTMGNKIAGRKAMNINILDVQTDCENWLQFNENQIKEISAAGLCFQFYSCIAILILLFVFRQFGLILWQEILFTMVEIIANLLLHLIPVKLSKDSATDSYWCLHPNEFLQSKYPTKVEK